jgi:hypothetical protein
VRTREPSLGSPHHPTRRPCRPGSGRGAHSSPVRCEGIIYSGLLSFRQAIGLDFATNCQGALYVVGGPGFNYMNRPKRSWAGATGGSTRYMPLDGRTTATSQ